MGRPERYKKLCVLSSECIRQRWDSKKTLKQNLMELGLSFDPNKSIPVRKDEGSVSQMHMTTK